VGSREFFLDHGMSGSGWISPRKNS